MIYLDFKDLIAYQKGFTQAMNIFKLSLSFPVEERYSLTDQIRRSSRSICTNMAEAYRKRTYPKHFHSKMTDCWAENEETGVWLNFAFQCNYISEEIYNQHIALNTEVGKLITYMINNPGKFGVKEDQ